MTLWMRNRFLLLLLSLSLATVCENTSRAAGQPLKERVDSLWTLANEHALYGRYAESIAVCRDLLDNYRLSGDARKSIVWLILSDANNAGDYRLWCQYARPRYAGKPARKYYKALAAQPPQALSRPDRDVNVPYSVDSIFFDGKYKGRMIKVPVTIAGKEERFLLDNGVAHFCSATETFAREHGIRPIGAETTVVGVAGRSSSWIGIADSLRVGELLLRNMLFLVVPDEALHNDVASIDAILGTGFFRTVGEMQFDNRAQTILFPAVQQDLPANLTINGAGMHFIDGTFRGETICFHLDLGSSTTSLNVNYYERRKEDVEATFPADSIKSGGIGGIIQYRCYRVADPDIVLDGAHFNGDHVTVDTVDMVDDPSCEGRLGNDALLYFDRAVLNIRKMFLYFE